MREDFETYQDNGCSVAPSCLRCPLPRCKYDRPTTPAETREERARRWSQMPRGERRRKVGIVVRSMLNRGPITRGDLRQIGDYFGVSRQRVHQIVVEERRRTAAERPPIPDFMRRDAPEPVFIRTIEPPRPVAPLTLTEIADSALVDALLARPGARRLLWARLFDRSDQEDDHEHARDAATGEDPQRSRPAAGTPAP
jgi:hypothetical protein